MTVLGFISTFIISAILVRGTTAQDDFIRLMMLSSLLSGGGFGGSGGSQGGNTGVMPQQNTQSMNGFEGDPRSMGGSGGSSASSGPGGLFGGLMGLLSRNGGAGAAPLLLDVDGDLLRPHLWQRGGIEGPGSGGPGGSAAPSSVSSVNPREVGPLSSQAGATGSARPKSMPHMALPFDIEFTGSAANPSPVEGASAPEAQVAPSGAGARPTGSQTPP